MSKTIGQPFITIVIPTYNRENLILETLETVWEQTYKNYEIIVVDNASEDNTVKILKPYVSKGKLTLIENSENLERSRARNIGFKTAKGDYLTLLDSDDFMYPECLQDAANFIKKHSDIHFFHNYFELVNDDKEPLRQYSFPSEKNQIERYAEGNFISCIGVFLSKEVYSNFHFNEDPNVIGSEDWELWFRVLAHYKLGSIPKVNHGIRHHDSRSITNYQLDSIVERKNYILDHVLQDSKVNKIFGQYENFMRSSVYVFAAVSANQAKNFKKAKAFLIKALKLHPKIFFTRRFLRVFQIAQFKLDITPTK